MKLYIPKLEDLWFRQMFMADEETMSYNHHWGGTIPFPEEDWADWYDYWIVNPEGKRFYRYLQEEINGEFVGEIAYHFDAERKINIADIIVYAKYRGKGFGEQGLLLLCEAAKANGVEILYDDIAMDNPAIKLFLKVGFYEEYRRDEIIMLKKELNKPASLLRTTQNTRDLGGYRTKEGTLTVEEKLVRSDVQCYPCEEDFEYLKSNKGKIMKSTSLTCQNVRTMLN